MKRLKVDGGMVANELLMQFQADMAEYDRKAGVKGWHKAMLEGEH